MKNLTDTGGFNGKVGDAWYFDGGISRALLSFFEEKNITSLVDIGCGEGQYVNFFNKNGEWLSEIVFLDRERVEVKFLNKNLNIELNNI